MKKGLCLAALLGVLVLIRCGGDDSSDEDGPPIPVSGNLSTGSHGFVSGGLGVTVGNVATVLSLSRSGNCRQAAVSGGSFTVDVATQTISGLLFLDAANKPLGYLTLGSDINTLPLVKLASGVTAIDLAAVSSSGTAATPGNNPIGSALPLSDEEKTAIAHGNTAFTSVVKNADVDGDGVIDCLQGRFYQPTFLYFIQGGSFGSNPTATPSTPADINQWSFAFRARDDEGDLPEDSQINFTGPAGSNLTNATCCQYKTEGFRQAPNVTNPTIPPEGDYTVKFGGRTLKFSIGSQSGANNNVILAIPTVTVEGNILKKVTWTYKLGNGGAALDPSAIIQDIELQIDGENQPICAEAKGGGGRVYDSGFVPPATTEHTLTCGTVDWDRVTRIHMAYNDIFDNHYVVTWNR